MFNSARKKADKVARAIYMGDYDKAIAMLQAGVDPNGVFRRQSDHATSLMVAVGKRHEGLVKLLIEKGADVNARDKDKDTALHYLENTYNGDAAAIVDALVAAGADVNAQGRFRRTPLMKLMDCYTDHSETVAALLRHGASIDEPQNSYGYGTLLIMASHRGHADIVRQLIAHGADVNATGNNGHTALHIAAAEGKMEVVKVLLESGANPIIRDNLLNTPFDLAQGKYTGIANYIREQASLSPFAFAGEVAKATGTPWVKIADDEIALISDKKAIGYRLTEIFNFARCELTQITRNLDGGAESSNTRAFNQCDTETIVRAAQELLALGGKLPEGQQPQDIRVRVLTAKAMISKPHKAG